MFEKPLGGTELMFNELVRRLPTIEEKFSIFNYTNKADFSKSMIYWNQLSYDQDSVKLLEYTENISRIDNFVFVSHWQAEYFRKIYRIPGEKTHVIKNACIGVSDREITKKEKLKICYTSTPWRGLDVLLKAWEILNPKNCELHVFSSCDIYGPEFSSNENQKYQYLYEWCQRLPNVVYRGSVPNEKLREELSEFDMLAYPCTFEETSCIAVIDALCAGLRVVTSAIGALPETTEGWARMYSYIEDREDHAKLFSEILSEEINLMFSGKLIDSLKRQKSEYTKNWHWDSRIEDWKKFLKKIEN